MARLFLLFRLLFLSASCKTLRIEESRNKDYVNPDIAMGNQFYVAAKQWDGHRRCYFIDVGNRIEQGPKNLRSNEQCAHAYRKEIGLGRYNGTLPPDSSPVRAFMQTYSKGDSVHCGTVTVGKRERKGLVDPSNGPKAQALRRSTTLVMLKNEGQFDITARVREPRKCRYEVVLEGPEGLLLGGPSDGLEPIEPVGEIIRAPKCEDDHAKCAVWARKGECTRNEEYMGANCRQACGLCDGAATAGDDEIELHRKGSQTRKPQKSSARYRDAAKVVQQTSREELISRPVKELRRLLRHLGAKCKACSEKVHFVDRLNEMVKDKDEL